MAGSQDDDVGTPGLVFKTHGSTMAKGHGRVAGREKRGHRLPDHVSTADNNCLLAWDGNLVVIEDF
ncbi:MAG: hypothetical protein K0S14_951 [Thermomicrobiales bacterium]|nr:hypothetical protein [Thermomicrobiales bacterium]